MQRRNVNSEALPFVTVAFVAADEEEWAGLVQPEECVAVFEGGYWVACVAVVVAPFVDHQDGVVLVIKS